MRPITSPPTSSNALLLKIRSKQMEEQAKIAAFKKETFLWIVVAVSILLFISNMGIGGHVGGTVSGFLFGVFGMVAYIFPIVLLVGTFFAVSNKDNAFAILKLISSLVFIWFMCVFLYLAVYGDFGALSCNFSRNHSSKLSQIRASAMPRTCVTYTFFP